MSSKKKTDPKKKKATKKKTSAYDKSSHSKSQQISDKLARKVARGEMSYSQARRRQRKADSTTMATKKKVNKTVRTSSEGLPTKRKGVKARYKRDKHGNVVAY